MKPLGVFEAKTRFSEVVSAAERGETTIVTRNGKPVAEISPVRSDGREAAREAVAQIRAFNRDFVAKYGPVSREEILAWIREGRKYLDDND